MFAVSDMEHAEEGNSASAQYSEKFNEALTTQNGGQGIVPRHGVSLNLRQNLHDPLPSHTTSRLMFPSVETG